MRMSAQNALFSELRKPKNPYAGKQINQLSVQEKRDLEREMIGKLVARHFDAQYQKLFGEEEVEREKERYIERLKTKSLSELKALLHWS